MTEETAKCRGCGRELRGKPYYMGGSAYHPDTGKRCPVNHYGGFVCSQGCDERAALELEQSMPGHSVRDTRLGQYSAARVRSNWASQ